MVLPGQLMDLQGVVAPDTAIVTQRSWVVPNKNFKDYQPAVNAALGTATSNLTQLQPGDITNETIQFYFADTGNKTVTAKAMVAGNWFTANATLNVLVPVANTTTTFGAVQFDPGFANFGLFANQSTTSCQVTFTTTGGRINNDAALIAGQGGTGYPPNQVGLNLNVVKDGFGGVISVNTNGAGVVTAVTGTVAAGIGYSNAVLASPATTQNGISSGITITGNVALPADMAQAQAASSTSRWAPMARSITASSCPRGVAAMAIVPWRH